MPSRQIRGPSQQGGLGSRVGRLPGGRVPGRATAHKHDLATGMLLHDSQSMSRTSRRPGKIHLENLVPSLLRQARQQGVSCQPCGTDQQIQRALRKITPPRVLIRDIQLVAARSIDMPASLHKLLPQGSCQGSVTTRDDHARHGFSLSPETAAGKAALSYDANPPAEQTVNEL